ncbi:MAG: RNA polymerase-binding protein RbpA [Actinobacteria bacterium]|nr:RNA polymerase-binding protein RbpA [Actinomycetota bacterium]
MSGSNAIRGARVGSGPMGEMDHGVRAERIAVSYFDILGNETVRYFAADVDPEEIPDQIDSPHSGLPAGRDQQNPPELLKNEPYKTHLAYVKERRTPEEAEELLEQALQKLRARRGSAAPKAA